MLLRIAVAALAALALGCAPEVAAQPAAHPVTPPPHGGAPPGGAVPAREKLAMKALTGPQRSPEAACAAASKANGLRSGQCTHSALSLPAGAPFGAALLTAADPSDPRFTGSGAWSLALGGDDAWFFLVPALDRINGAAGHLYLPVVSLIDASVVGPRVLLRLRDATSKVCNPCDGPDRDKKQPAPTRTLALVCGKDRAGRPACTAPMEVEENGKVTLSSEGIMAIAAPGTAPKLFEVF